MFRLALIQMNVIGGRKADNLAHAEALIAQAAPRADVLLLPEAMPVGWTHPLTRELADQVSDGKTCIRLRSAARRHSRYICSGLVERAGDLVYNARPARPGRAGPPRGQRAGDRPGLL